MKKVKGAKTTWQKTRKFFNDIHLWAGLISGIVVILICLSGTIYTYNTELVEMSAPHLYKVEIPENGKRKPIEESIELVERVSGGAVTAVSIPADPARTYQVTARIKDDKSRFGTIHYIHPYTGELLGSSKDKTRMQEFMGYMFSLHRWLLLDKIDKPLFGELPNRKLGSYISGTATLLFTIGVITGFVIWFPQKLRNWRQGLTVKWNANWKRINHDLHNTTAFYSLIFLFLMGITGPQWSFPWYRTGLQKVLGTYKETPVAPIDASAQQSGRQGLKDGRSAAKYPKTDEPEEPVSLTLLAITRYIAAADEALPYKGDYQVTLPREGNDLTIRKNKTGFFAPAAGDQVSLEASTAAIKEVSVFREKPFNERVAGSIKALHIGNVYGQFTKALYFLACLIATSLPITGTLIWLNKMKKSQRKKPLPNFPKRSSIRSSC